MVSRNHNNDKLFVGEFQECQQVLMNFNAFDSYHPAPTVSSTMSSAVSSRIRRQTREKSFSPACVPHPAPTVSSTMSSACPLLYCSYSRVAPWESLLLPMRQALPVRVWKPHVGLPLSIDFLLRPRGRKLRTLHRCHALPASPSKALEPSSGKCQE